MRFATIHCGQCRPCVVNTVDEMPVRLENSVAWMVLKAHGLHPVGLVQASHRELRDSAVNNLC